MGKKIHTTSRWVKRKEKGREENKNGSKIDFSCMSNFFVCFSSKAKMVQPQRLLTRALGIRELFNIFFSAVLYLSNGS